MGQIYKDDIKGKYFSIPIVKASLHCQVKGWRSPHSMFDPAQPWVEVLFSLTQLMNKLQDVEADKLASSQSPKLTNWQAARQTKLQDDKTAGWQDDNMISSTDVGGLVDYHHHDHVWAGVGLHPLSSQLVCPYLGSSSPLVIIIIIIITSSSSSSTSWS